VGARAGLSLNLSQICQGLRFFLRVRIEAGKLYSLYKCDES
jgi:hypothetical protein